MSKKENIAAPSKATGPSENGFSLKQFENECLGEHNRLRALHGCPPLKLNQKISTYATAWAKKLGAKNKMEHRKERKYGENLFMASGTNVDGKLPVKLWYDEIGRYDFDKAKFSTEIGHFTQLIWKATKELGIGIEKKGNKTWVVANYNPPGNFLNEFQENVPRIL